IICNLAFFLFGPQSALDKLIFYLPVFVIVGAAVVFLFDDRLETSERRALLAVTVAAAAAFMEAFPRFAPAQAKSPRPLVVLLLIVLMHGLRPVLKKTRRIAVPFAPAMIILATAFALSGGRLFFNTYFDTHRQFKSNTELAIDRGRGVYFPQAQAREIES